MNPANATNAPDSGTASASTPAATERPRANDPQSASSESEYLEQQASAAKAAISGAFADLKTDLAKGVDPRVWIKSHPWITMASAAVAGFAAAATVVPSKEEQALRRLEAIEEAIHGKKHAGQAGSNGNGSDETARSGHGGLIGMILHELLAVIKPAIVTLISSHFASKEPTENPADTTASLDTRDVS